MNQIQPPQIPQNLTPVAPVTPPAVPPQLPPVQPLYVPPPQVPVAPVVPQPPQVPITTQQAYVPPVVPQAPAPPVAPVAPAPTPNVDQGIIATDQGVQFNGMSDDMFDDQRVKFFKLEDGETRFRLLPPYAPKKMYFKADLHWGFTDLEGNKKALTCSKFTAGQCPICDEVERLKGMVENYKAQPPNVIAQYQGEIVKLEDRIGDIKRKPTYLWNVLTDKGEQKVVSLSWNAHKPLEDKVKFYWNEKKINITDLRHNMMIWCSRTGKKAKTRYQYEVLDATASSLSLAEPLKDLSLTYMQRDFAYLSQVLNSGVTPTPNADPNDRNFDTQGSSAAYPTPPVQPPYVPPQAPPVQPPYVPPQAPPVPMPPTFNAAEPIPETFQQPPQVPVAPPVPPAGQNILQTMAVPPGPGELPAPYRADDPSTHGVNAPPVPPVPPAYAPPPAPVAPQAVVQPLPPAPVVTAPVPAPLPPPVAPVAPQAPPVAPLTTQDQGAVDQMMASLQQGVTPS